MRRIFSLKIAPEIWNRNLREANFEHAILRYICVYTYIIYIIHISKLLQYLKYFHLANYKKTAAIARFI